MMKHYNLVVLGGGPGGYVAAIRAAQLGKKTAIIDNDKLGGICLNWGCIPTKALLKNAEILHYIKNSKKFGITIPSFDVNFNETIKRSRDVSKRLSKGIEFLMKKNKIDHIVGRGAFKSDKEIEVNNGKNKEVVRADRIIIATGARSRILPGIEPDGKYIITSKEAMNLKTIPKKMLIIGAGAIGAEFAYFYNEYGSEVTLVEMMDNILPVEDEDISKELEKSFINSGIKIHKKTRVTHIKTLKNKLKVFLEISGKEQIIETDIVLNAVGVIGNIEKIGLEDIGVETKDGAISINDYNQTSIENIYAIGDVSGPPWLAHVASAQGHVAVEHAFGHSTNPLDYNNIPGCTYCQPRVASIGMTEVKAKEAGHEVKIGRFNFSASGKALAIGESLGFVKIIFDAKYGELLGCHIIGSEATELIAELAIAKALETTWEEIATTVHAHPTLSEAVMEAALDAFGKSIHQ